MMNGWENTTRRYSQRFECIRWMWSVFTLLTRSRGEYDPPILTALRVWTVDEKRIYSADVFKGKIVQANNRTASNVYDEWRVMGKRIYGADSLKMSIRHANTHTNRNVYVGWLAMDKCIYAADAVKGRIRHANTHTASNMKVKLLVMEKRIFAADALKESIRHANTYCASNVYCGWKRIYGSDALKGENATRQYSYRC